MRSGTFRLSACAVVQYRGRPLQGTYSVGLLTKGPRPEGTGAEELVMDGYARQSVHFGPPAQFSETVQSGERVTFGGLALPTEVRQAALYDATDSLVAYGLISAVPGFVLADELAFEAGAISVRF